MHHVFVSYSRSDSQWVAGLVQLLESDGHDAWLDQRDLPMSLPWFEEVRDAIVEADLVVICDSPAARGSHWCSAEVAQAREAAKPMCVVNLGSDVAAAAAAARDAAPPHNGPQARRTDLAVLARNWDRAGRRSGALASLKARRRLLPALSVAPPLTAVEQEFLAASRRRGHRRIAASAVVALVGVAALTVTSILTTARDRITVRNGQQALVYTRARAALKRSSEDPYAGLSLAAASGGTESAVAGVVISGALEPAVPDLGFPAPRAAVAFASPLVGREVVLARSRGRNWTHALGPGATPATVSSHRPLNRLRARRIRRTGIIEIREAGRLLRRIAFPEVVRRVRVAPNGREVAAAGVNAVYVADVGLGKVRRILHGSGERVADVAWSADASRVWAKIGDRVVSWRLRSGTLLVDDRRRNFTALLPAAADRALWLVAQDGLLQLMDTGSGRTVRALHVPGEVKSAGGSPDGSLAALSGDRDVAVVSLRHRAPVRRFRPAGCDPGRPAFISRDVFVVPCLGGPLLTVSVRDLRTLARTTVPGGAFAVRPMPKNRMLLFSNTWGALFTSSASRAPSEIFHSRCGGKITRIAVAANETAVAPVGEGTGVVGCIRRGLLRGADPADPRSWRFDGVNDPVTTSVLAPAAAVSNSGRTFAYGYSDGTVVLHPSVNITPTVAITDISGAIRDMYVLPNDDVVIASDAGVVERVRLCDACLSNRALAAVAEERLRLGVKLGQAEVGVPGIGQGP